jgi:hypothetical protein
VKSTESSAVTDDDVTTKRSSEDPFEQFDVRLLPEENADKASQIRLTAMFLVRAAAIGTLTGLSVVVFKTLIAQTQVFYYERYSRLHHQQCYFLYAPTSLLMSVRLLQID